MPISKISKKRKMTCMSLPEDIKALMGKNLKRIRLAHGLKQNKLAEMINSDSSTLSSIETGKKGLGKDLQSRLCRALKIQASEFTRHLDDLPLGPLPPGKIAVISMGKEGNGHSLYYIDKPYDVNDENAYGLEVRGSGMNPRYEEGEIVIASPEKPVTNGDYVIVQLTSGERLVKKIKFREGLIILTSVNPAIEAWICRPEEILSYDKIVWKKEK